MNPNTQEAIAALRKKYSGKQGCLTENDLYLVEENGLRGVYSIKAGKLIVPIEYDSIQLKGKELLLGKFTKMKIPE